MYSGSLGGREERTDAFAGEPKSVGGTLGGHGAHGTTSLTEPEGGKHHTKPVASTGTTGTSHTGTSHTGTTGSSTTDSTTGKPSLMSKLDPRKDADGDGKKGFMS